MSKNTYEFTYIVSSVLGDDQIKNLVNRVTKFIEKEGGNIIEVDEWGSQRLAYPIDKKRTGYYVNAYFEAEGDLIARLERALTLEDDILRFLTLKMDAVMLRHYEERKKERAREQAESLAASKEKKAEAPAKEKKVEAPAEEKKAEAPAKETKAEAPAEEKKAEAPAEEKKAETPAEEKKAETPAEEKKAEAPAEETKTEASAPSKKAADEKAADEQATDKA